MEKAENGFPVYLFLDYENMGMNARNETEGSMQDIGISNSKEKGVR